MFGWRGCQSNLVTAQWRLNQRQTAEVDFFLSSSPFLLLLVSHRSRGPIHSLHVSTGSVQYCMNLFYIETIVIKVIADKIILGTPAPHLYASASYIAEINWAPWPKLIAWGSWFIHYSFMSSFPFILSEITSHGAVYFPVGFVWIKWNWKRQ